MNPLIDKIEAYGRAVDQGLITRDTAAADLAQASGGGLTEVGARDVIGTWKTTRASYQKTFDDTERALRRRGR